MVSISKIIRRAFVFNTLFFLLLSGWLNAAEIKTSPLDHRKYRVITLDNQMDVILVSDPQVKRASAAMSIQVGSYNDPEDIAGMAHFLEHMLFLGTEKYPDAAYYSNFISSHGGYSNAFTKATDTVYFYEIDYNYLEQSLDNFSRFFIDPLFSKEFTDRELNAINAEHSKNIQNDNRRSYHILKELAKPTHPFSQFSTGNRETLEIHEDLNERLLEFYDKYYSANLMTLAVIGRESLDQLEKISRQYFSEVKNKKVASKTYDWQKYDPDILPAYVQIKPLELKRTLSLTFYQPGEADHYRYKIGSYIGNVMGDESANSLFNFLKNKNLVNSLGAYAFNYDDNGAAGFNVYMDLTEEGEKQTDAIIGYFFEYLNLLKEKEIQEWRYNEMKKISDNDFRYAFQPKGPSELVIDLASNNRYTPIEDLNYRGYRFDRFRPDLIESFLEHITPENMLVVQVSPNAKVNKKEKWYQAEYSVEKIGAKKISTWKKAAKAQNNRFKLPEKNKYINDAPAIYPKKDESNLPKQIYDEPGMSFYFLQDQTFKQSDAVLLIKAALPNSLKSVKNTALTKLYISMLSDKLNAELYHAKVAQYDFSISPTLNGLTIRISGYFKQIPNILKTLLSELDMNKMPPSRFDVIKQNMLKGYQNERLKPANEAGANEFRYINSKHNWNYEQYLKVIPGITLKDLNAYQATLFDKSFLEVFLYGNARAKDAEEIHAILNDYLNYKPVDRDSLPVYQNLKLTDGIDLVQSIQTEDKDSSVMIVFQNPKQTLKNLILNDILLMSFRDAAYYQLRTVEQLGYIVGAFSIAYNETPQAGILVQSPDKTPDYLERRIRDFLNQFKETLAAMPEDALESQKQVLNNMYLQEPKSFNEAFAKFASALEDRDFKLERNHLLSKILKTITKEDLIAYYEETFLSDKNREFITQVYGKALKLPKQKDEGNRQFIQNNKQFKASAEYFPHLYFSDIASAR